MERGKFICVEGADKIGKTTLALALANYLKAPKLQFPTRKGKIGQILNSFLEGSITFKNLRSSHYLFSIDRWEMQDKIKEYLDNGTTIIVDRYNMSGYVYTVCQNQAAKSWAKNADQGLILPDVYIVVHDPDPEALALRNESSVSNERYEKADFQKKVNTQFVWEAYMSRYGIPTLCVETSTDFKDENKLMRIVQLIEQVSCE